MDRHELNRMFDGLTPDPRRERELLRQLLQDDARRKTPMKNWKRVVMAAAAAVLLVTGAAAAVVPGISQRMLAYLGVDPEDAQTTNLLAPGAVAVDIVKEDNGATLHVTQILRDRNCIMVLADFTAPEGTVLDLGINTHESSSIQGFTTYFQPEGEGLGSYFLDKDGNQSRDGMANSGIGGWDNIADDDPQDNHATLVYTLTMRQDNEAFQQAQSLWIPAFDLSSWNWEKKELRLLYAGNWSFEVPLPQKDTGWTQRLDCFVGELDGGKISVGDLYISPMTLEITLKRDVGMDMDDTSEEAEQAWIRWIGLVIPSSVTLTTRDGETVTLDWYLKLANVGELEDWEQAYSFTLSSITDPSKLQGGTITVDLRFDTGTVTLPLDDLIPVEP